MAKDKSPLRPKSIYSEQTDSSARSDGIVALGRKLVEELGLEPSVDTLGRWMAHYISNLIATTESAAGEERTAAETRCFDAILKLWAHRTELPNGKRPFRSLEPIVRAIESLDPNDSTPRYYRGARPPGDADDKKSGAESWLSLVDSLDYSAKVLIAYSLGEAARVAVDKSKEWVRLAEAAGVDDGPSEIVVRFVTREAGLGSDPDPIDAVREQIEKRIRRLESFTAIARTVANEMKDRLKALPPSKSRKTRLERKTEPERKMKPKPKKTKAKAKLRKRHKGNSR